VDRRGTSTRIAKPLMQDARGLDIAGYIADTTHTTQSVGCPYELGETDRAAHCEMLRGILSRKRKETTRIWRWMTNRWLVEQPI